MRTSESIVYFTRIPYSMHYIKLYAQLYPTPATYTLQAATPPQQVPPAPVVILKHVDPEATQSEAAVVAAAVVAAAVVAAAVVAAAVVAAAVVAAAVVAAAVVAAVLVQALVTWLQV